MKLQTDFVFLLFSKLRVGFFPSKNGAQRDVRAFEIKKKKLKN